MQPLQHQHTDRPKRITVVVPSSIFTPGVAYGVIEWRDGMPWVHNDTGSKTWLIERRWWAPVPEPMTHDLAQDLLHAAWRASRAAAVNL